MKKLFLLLITLLIMAGLTGCGAGNAREQAELSTTGTGPETVEKIPPSAGEARTQEDGVVKLKIKIGDTIYHAILTDSPATQTLVSKMPMTLDMREMNGNEKYFFLPESLPVNAEVMGTIRTGDLMLYGTDCLVLFYEDFQSSYSYTRLGTIEDPAGLAAALGSGNVEVAFSLAE